MQNVHNHVGQIRGALGLQPDEAADVEGPGQGKFESYDRMSSSCSCRAMFQKPTVSRVTGLVHIPGSASKGAVIPL